MLDSFEIKSGGFSKIFIGLHVFDRSTVHRSKDHHCILDTWWLSWPYSFYTWDHFSFWCIRHNSLLRVSSSPSPTNGRFLFPSKYFPALYSRMLLELAVVLALDLQQSSRCLQINWFEERKKVLFSIIKYCLIAIQLYFFEIWKHKQILKYQQLKQKWLNK